MTTADKCKYIRKKREISQYKMANLHGTNQTEVSFIERGFVPQDEQKIQKINELYNFECSNGQV